MKAFELLSAPGLWLLAGLVPIVALYLLKIRRVTVLVPSSWLWAAAQRDLLAKHPWRRLTREVPLILEILATGALALALARPATRGGTIQGDHVAIVIDTSASMLATEEGGTRIERAKALAKDAVDRLAVGTDAFVVDAGHHALAATALERDRRALKDGIGRLDAREVEGDLAAGVGLAADRLRSLTGSRRILIFTDGASADGPLSTGGIDAEAIRVGEKHDNAGIVRIDARRGEDPVSRRDEIQVFVLVESFGDGPREAYVTVTIDGRGESVASRRVTLPPHERTPIALSFEPHGGDEGAGIAVRIAPGDALAADDVAYARIPVGRSIPVVLASNRDRSWIGRALAADADVDLRTIRVGQLATVNVDAGALVVVEGACPTAVPARDVLIVAPGEGDCLGVHVGAETEGPRTTSWDTSDPRLRFLTLEGVHVSRSRFVAAQDARALVRAATTALVADASTGARTATVVAFDPSESDWPVQASFVLFVRNVVELARTHRDQGASAPARTGDPIRVAVPPGVEHVRVESEVAGASEVEARDGFALVPAVSRAGLVKVRWFEPHVGASVAAVNMVSERESDIRPRDVRIDTGAGASAPIARAPQAHHEWAAWLALLAAGLMLAELAWLTRTAATPQRRSPWLFRAIAGVACAPLAYEALVRAGALSGRELRFGSPVALVAVAVAGCLLSWGLARLSPRTTRLRRGLLAVTSSVAVLATALAVAEPELGLRLDRMAVVVAVDRSRSIDLVPGADRRITADLALAQKSMREGDRIGTVVFAAEAATEDPPRPRSELAPSQRIEVGRDGTDLEAAIRRALAEVPADTSARVVLETDGVETRGDVLGAAEAAQAAGVPIDTVLLEQGAVRNVRIVSVGAPTKSSRDEPFDLRVVTSSTSDADVEVRVSRDGDPILEIARAHVTAGEDVLRLRQTASDAGLHRYDVAVTALDPTSDSSPEDNQGSAFVRVSGPSIALVLDGDQGAGAPLARAFEEAGFLVMQRSLVGAPATVGELAAYDLVTLADVPASDLATSQLDALAAYVRDVGGGLLLMGGDRAMGPGGYARTPIEDVSPVAFDLKKEERRASLAEVIAIDYSGSMGMAVGGRTKLALANEAAARSASLLGHGDRLAVEHVDTEVRWTIPLGPVDDPEAIGARIRSVGVGGGGIYTDLALEAGYDALAPERVNLKHVLLFADGDDAEQIAGCRAIVHGAAARGITTSVISLGRGHDSPELEALSREGGGRFYLIDDAAKLPAVFTQETILATKSAIHEDPFSVSLGAPSPATRGVDFGAAPALGGYVVTVAKPRATVALSGPEGDPILATWTAGLGRAGAFASDYRDRWGASWLAWDGSAKAFGQIARDLARKEGDSRVRLESDATRGELHVRADVVGDDGRAQTFRRLRAHVAGPDGFTKDLPLEAVGAGRYAASVALSRPGTYVATATDEDGGPALGTTAAALDRGEELRPTGSNRALLVRIASMTGGKVRDTLAGVFDDRDARRFAYAPLAPWLTILAGISLVLAVASRKVALHAAVSDSGSAVRREPSAGRVLGSSAPPTAPSEASTAIPPVERPLSSAELLAKRRRERR